MSELDFLQRSVLVIHWNTFNGLQSIETINDFAKDGVVAVQMRLLRIGDKELRLVTVASRVGHRDDSSGIEFER